MYMEKIVAAQGAPAASHPLLRRVVGMPVLTLSALVMVPFLASYALYAGVMLGVRSLKDMVDYAGSVALGR